MPIHFSPSLRPRRESRARRFVFVVCNRVRPISPEYVDYKNALEWARWFAGDDATQEKYGPFVIRKLPPGTAFEYAVKWNYQNFLETFDVLGKIVTRRMSTKSLAGPIGIAQISGEMYRRGFTDLLAFVAFISLQLGIVNLLPIPVMDGGHIFMLAIEGLMRRDLSLAVKERVIQVGVVLIVLLFVFVMYNDIMKTIRPS